MGIKFLFMFVHHSVDSSKHKAVIELPQFTMYIQGVSNFDEGVQVAKQLVQKEGVDLIELCGGFGYAGAKHIAEGLGDEVPVGMIVHQVWNGCAIAKLIKEGME